MAFLARMWRGALLLLAMAVPALAHADESLRLHEPEIKAGLLYNFLKYTDWPQASLARAPSITVCIFGDDPFEGYLNPMAGRTVNQRPIALHPIHAAHEAEACQLLFVNAEEKAQWPSLHDALAGKNVLTVSDFPGFAASGGMIEFSHKDNRISVNLNIDAATASGLHVQERLLRLVSVVHAAPDGNSP